MTNEISTQNQETAMVSFIERAASDKEVDIVKFERLIELQNKERDRQARIAYYSDMAQLQSEMPTIAENGVIKVNGQLRSRYAKHEDIVAACRPLLQKYGFSFSAKTDFSGGQLIIEGIVAHKLGHTEETKMVLPFDNSGSKNSVQAIGSSVSYGRRYVFSMLFNITTGEDDDGQGALPPSLITPEEARQVSKRLEDTRSNVSAFLKALGAASVDQIPLNLVAKANSMLTAKERSMKKDAENAGN